MNKIQALKKIYRSRKIKYYFEPVSYVVVQVPDYNGGWRIEYFGYTKKCQERAMEIADEYLECNFTYILDYEAREGDRFEEHYEPFHDDPRDVPVFIDSRTAKFILR